jgi:hypothetical protein
MDDTTKKINELEKAVVDLHGTVGSIGVTCEALKMLQTRMLYALYEIDPSIHLRILEHLKNFLEQEQEQLHLVPEMEKYFRSLVGKKTSPPKPRLSVVQRKEILQDGDEP